MEQVAQLPPAQPATMTTDDYVGIEALMLVMHVRDLARRSQLPPKKRKRTTRGTRRKYDMVTVRRAHRKVAGASEQHVEKLKTENKNEKKKLEKEDKTDLPDGIIMVPGMIVFKHVMFPQTLEAGVKRKTIFL